MQKYLMSVFLILITLLILSCDINIPPDLQSENWIAMIDVDGNNLQYICKDIGDPYFVPDPDNQDQELILVSGFPNIDLMNMDGSNRRTIIDSVGGVYRLSGDRTKMLLVNDGEIYIANTDGTGLENLTNTPDRIEDEPSFSSNYEKVIYCYSDFEDSISVVACKEIFTGLSYNIYEEEFNICFTYFKSPIFINNNTIVFGQSFSGSDSLNIEGLFLFDNGIKTLLDSGYINSKISYNDNKKILAYKNYTQLKLYHLETGEIDIIEGNYGYNKEARFNGEGNLLSIISYIIDTESLVGYNILHSYENEVSNVYNPMDFNFMSTKVIMNLERIFPNSN